MKATRIILAGLLVAWFGASAALAYTIPDAVSDSTGGVLFDTYGIDYHREGTTLTLSVDTNFWGDLTLDTWNIRYADMLFDTDGDGKYEYAVVFSTEDGSTSLATPGTAGLYAIGDYTSLSDRFWTSDDFHTAENPSNVGFLSGQPVKLQDIAANTLLGTVGVSFSMTPPPGFSNISGSPPWFNLQIVLTGLDPTIGALFDSADVYWGTATCGNDPVTGQVPLPPAVYLLGSGIAVLVLPRRRPVLRRRS